MISIGTMAGALAQNPVFGVTATLLAYEIGRKVQRRCGGQPIANPVLIAIALLVAGLELSGTSYDAYFKGGGLIQFLLGPATVALALPIYANAARIRAALAGIAAGVIVGATIACASAVGIAWALGAPDDLIRSIAPKSVTTPIAIGISQEIGGHPSLTAVLVVTSGIIGAMLSGRLYDWIGVRNWEARGLATGIASHGIGTAQMLSENETAGAFAGLAIGLTGLFAAIVLPFAACLL